MTKNDTANYVLHAKSDEFYWKGNGQLSIKTFSNGKARYHTKQGFYAIEESRYLLLNAGPYIISIDEPREVESFCIFFQDGFAEEVFHSLSETNDRLLSDPFKDKSPLGFFERTYPKNMTLSAMLHTFKQALPGNDQKSIGYEQQFHQIMQALLEDQLQIYQEVESLNAVRKSTREELYRRINIANEYIRAYFDRPVKLDDIAAAACLSPNHLLRTYQQLYKRTPHQHITEFRIQKARQLLSETDYTMTEITFLLGLQNPVSFSKLFKQFAGMSPADYRKKVRMDKTR
ncbi:AraC family transcriptional regulator [Rossellomorea aquimaris]|uniref:AraC family transcriptional regulator n=1 Tax=Rossellomorea aquimaris TaxID=189382 RepID=A0A1J6WI52_9BACI|nr:AraC family transcriptional regulator [Rossellomorea aquimaris]OIU71528.1 AraC family transcriptional regulator [Rossellomorea aquimaris]